MIYTGVMMVPGLLNEGSEVPKSYSLTVNCSIILPSFFVNINSLNSL